MPANPADAWHNKDHSMMRNWHGSYTTRQDVRDKLPQLTALRLSVYAAITQLFEYPGDSDDTR